MVLKKTFSTRAECDFGFFTTVAVISEIFVEFHSISLDFKRTLSTFQWILERMLSKFQLMFKGMIIRFQLAFKGILMKIQLNLPWL